MIVYIHGFNSSPASFKARLLNEALRKLGREHEFVAPKLPPDPDRAIDVLETAIAPGSRPCLVGSSLGGYYAIWLAEKFGLRAALVNPSVRPYETLAAYLGTQQNLYTGERYEFTHAHVTALRRLEVEPITRPERYLLLVGTADEVLDYRQATAKFAGVRRIVVEGENHAFRGFGAQIDTVLAFCGCATGG